MSVTDAKGSVKRRTYDARGRQAAAAQLQSTVLDAAWQLFSVDGYAATTIETIARDAAVSTATIYKGFGGKPGLVRALVTRALRGDPAAGRAAEARSDAARDEAPDGPTLVRTWGALVAEVSPRVSPILLLLRDVAGQDSAAASLFDELERDRRTRMAENARALDHIGALRPGTSRAEARDVLWFYSAPDLFDVLVQRGGWSIRRYSRFVADAMIAALL